MIRRIGLAVLLSLGVALAARAAEVTQVKVSRDGPAYIVHGVLTVAVPRPAAFHAATQFKAIAQQAELIQSAQWLDADRLSSRLSMCVLFYCKTVQQVTDVAMSAPRQIVMRIVPGRGDFKSGRAVWHFTNDTPAQTRILFDARMVPAFWVPPMIGNWAIARALRGQIADTGAAIESLAKTPAAGEAATR